MSKSAAAEAGLKEGDIIQSIDGTQLHRQSFQKGLLDIDLKM
jgi:S1-C subfamily serine protease